MGDVTVTDEELGELSTMGCSEVDKDYCHWSLTSTDNYPPHYHDLMKTPEGWRAVTFRAEDTGSCWESPGFPTVAAAFVYGELNQWGL